MKTGHSIHPCRHAIFPLLVLILFLISNPGHAQFYGPSPDQLLFAQTPGLLSYLKPLNSQERFFAEVSGTLDEDDPISDFLSYINDPLNWDPTEPIDRQFVYQGNFGYQQTGRIFDIPGTLSLGVQTRLDQALVGYRRPSSGIESSSPIPLNLLDGMHAPYLTLHTQPLPWLRVLGDARLDVVTFDLQKVCRTTCSKEPNGENNEVIPSLKGNVILGPWLGTELFLNLGTGFYNPNDREPAGSTMEEKVSRTTAYEGGIRTQPWDEVELNASLWSVELRSDLLYLEDGETIEDGGPSRRFGANLGAQVNLTERLTLAANLSVSRAEFRQSGQQVPLAPELTSRIGLTSEWEDGFVTTFQMNYTGQRPNEESTTTLPPFATFDLKTRYQPNDFPWPENFEITAGILNLTNETGPSTQFFLDSNLGVTQSPVADLNYFPGQPRMFIGGLTWTF